MTEQSDQNDQDEFRAKGEVKGEVKSSPYTVKVLKTNKDGLEQPHCCEVELLPPVPFSALVVGKTASGKSLATFNLLSNPHLLGGYFDFIILFVGVKPDPDMIKILKLPKENIKKDFTIEEVDQMMDKMELAVDKNGFKKCPKTLYLFDDILSRSDFLKSPVFTKMMTTNRHMGLSVILLTQYYKKMPSVARTNCSYYMIFPSNLQELDKISEELTPPNMSKKEFIKVAQHATKNKYQFLSINTKAESDKMLRKNFDTFLTL